MIGRDKDGLFKNQSNYIRLRNKVNSQEDSHKKVFERINAKLVDKAYIESTVEISAPSAGATAATEKNKTAANKPKHAAGNATNSTNSTKAHNKTKLVSS